jgi:hypothetical protein
VRGAQTAAYCTSSQQLQRLFLLVATPFLYLHLAAAQCRHSKGVCRVISRSISAYLVQAWDVRNSCKHNGAVLPLFAAPVGRGADGVDAMA